MKGSPQEWAAVVVKVARRHGADRIVAERNFGGAMVEAVLRTEWPDAPITMVTASRGKVARAEPIAALYETGRVVHAHGLDGLEGEMKQMTSSGFSGEGSPNAVDAAVWAMTELMDGAGAGPVYRTGAAEITVPPFPIPAHWRRAYGLVIGAGTAHAVWLAEDASDKVIYAHASYAGADAPVVIHAEAIKARGPWLRGAAVVSDAAKPEAVALRATYRQAGVKMIEAVDTGETGIAQIDGMLRTHRLRVFSTATSLIDDLPLYRRAVDGGFGASRKGLVDALRHGVTTFGRVGRLKPAPDDYGHAMPKANAVAGY